jgi:DNA-binding transcriptional ArsR family regulator
MTTAALAVVDEEQHVRTLLRGPRMRLLAALRNSPDSASGLSARLGMPRQTINYHLRQLEQAGLLELVEERGHGRCVERVVAPTSAAIAVSPAALGPLAPRSADMGDRASAEYLAARAGEVVRDLGRLLRTGDASPTLPPEPRIRFAGVEERAAFARDLQEAIATLVSRYHDSGADGGTAFTVLVAAHREAT